METKTETLVILTPAFPGPGEELYLVLSQQLLVRSIKKNFPGLQLIIVSFFYPEKKVQYPWHAAEVISIGIKKWKVLRVFDRFRAKSALNKITNKNDVIGVLSFWCTECAFYGNKISRKRNIQHLTWICGQDARANNEWVRFIEPAKEELIAMSPFLASEFEKSHGIRPAHTILNAIDPSLFDQTNKERRDIDVLGAGSLIPLKQYDQFVDVIASLKELHPDINSKLSGEGEERNKITQKIMELGLEKNLALLGSTKHKELLQLMQRTKVFLHTSNYEGCSTVCLEALYAGAHVISYCYPFDTDTPHWHVVKNKNEMIAKAKELISLHVLDHSSMLIQSMDESAKQIMKLFGK